jgi:hypothetical protein
MRSLSTRNHSPADCAIEAMVIATYEDDDRQNNHVARKLEVDPATTSRWRSRGIGPVRAIVDYLRDLPPRQAMRVAQTVQAAARMVALSTKTTPELIALYWECRVHEADKEARDRAMESRPAAEWDWTEGANATARDGSIEDMKEAIQRVFDIRKVAPADVLCVARRLS